MARSHSNRQAAKDFHIADFVAWNNKDFDMQRHHHAADVVVEWGGTRTQDLERGGGRSPDRSCGRFALMT
jgi:hypothetical protein